MPIDSQEAGPTADPSRPPWGLVIETGATPGAHAALVHQGKCVAQSSLTEGERSAKGLISLVDQLLKTHAVAPQQLDWLALTVGPGSFTGLRVGITFAKMFAFATGVRLIPIDSFLPYERRHRELVLGGQAPAGKFWTVTDAQRRQYFVRCQDLSQMSAIDLESHEPSLEAPKIVDPQEWLSALGPEDRVGGPVSGRIDPEQLERLGVWRLPEREQPFPIDSLVAIAIAKSLSQEFVSAEALMPVYGRASAAEEKRK